MSVDELGLMHEVDVSEEGSAIFRQHGALIEKIARAHQRAWLTEDDWSPSVRRWQEFVRAGGSAFGAFHAGRLIGVAVLRTRLTSDTDQLAALYIDRSFRRRGVASELVRCVIDLARESGALNLYVSAAPSEAAVSFYLDCGFTPVAEPHPELFEFEPDDIHMSMELS